METNESKLSKFGLSASKVKETLKNVQLTNTLLTILKLVNYQDLSGEQGILLYHLASKMKPTIQRFLPHLTMYVMDDKLTTIQRIDKGLEYMIKHAMGPVINWGDFELYCGVGVVVTPEQIEKIVELLLRPHHDEIRTKRYRFGIGPIIHSVREALPWADGKAIKNEVDLQVFDLIGPKTELDYKPATNSSTTVKTAPPITQLSILDIMRKVKFHLPGENYKTEGYIVNESTEKLLKLHLEATGGRVVTRFPPEPNGILHIGHAKAININFGYAQAHNGVCYLRYDDTNPEKEEEKFFVGIKEMVTWLGYTPYKVTHSSDYFEQLYAWAVELIKMGVAYVCHQSVDEMRGFDAVPSPWRDRAVPDNLQLFDDMRHGKIEEGAATLRLKLTLEEGKMDPVAYRIKFVPHHRTGNAWCIYPTYDYTHCLCDSLENITHSLCTKEFQSRRSSYYWLCNTLNIYCPVQWEYGRLNVNYTVVSKRKIAELIRERIVNDWDDPRLFTLTALRRRGFPPQAINNFCAQLGVTGAQSTVDPSMLEAYVRDYLNTYSERRMAVLAPLKITVLNHQTKPITITVPNHPKPGGSCHQVTFQSVIYIDQSDFRLDTTEDEDYRRLTRQQPVGLRHANYLMQFVAMAPDGDGIQCTCTAIEAATTKPKAYIHWVSNPIPIEVRIYTPLFKHKNPEDPNEVPNGFLSDCNLDSLQVHRGLIDKAVKTTEIYRNFQFERIGYFALDPDTTENLMVFNKTVGLKEDPGK